MSQVSSVGRRARPSRLRRRKARWFREDLLAWLSFVTFGSLVLLAAHLWLHRRVIPERRSLAGAVEDAQILILAFDRVVTEPTPGKISAGQLRRYLSILRDAGFVAVSAEELSRFYESQEPLPRKSVLLTFDHGYLSTYSAADPVLRELRWPAVLFVMTSRQEQRDPFFVYWDRVRRMVASGIWELGSHGHRGHDPVPVDGEGAAGPFFIRAKWLADRNRPETWEEFARRVELDHRRAQSLVEQETGQTLLAYAPPLRDVVGLSAAPEAHQVTDGIVRSIYRLAFFDDRFGVNDRRSDPNRLKRLRVEPGWSPEELLRRVTPSMEDVTAAVADAAGWVTGSGELRSEGTELVISGLDRADLWRAGSQWLDDFELECDFKVGGGQLWIVQESDRNLEHWRLGGTENRLYLQIRSPGERTDVVESYRASILPGRWHHLRLVKRGLGIVAELDYEPLSEHPTFLPGRWRGNVGLVHWSPQPERSASDPPSPGFGGSAVARRAEAEASRGARAVGVGPHGTDGSLGEVELRLRGLRFAEVPFEAHVVSSSLPAEEIQAAVARVSRISALSPHLLEIEGGVFRKAAIDEKLLKILSRRFAWEIVPTFVVSGDDAVVAAEDLSRALSFFQWEEVSGLRVVWRSVSAPARARITETLETLARDHSWKRGRLVVVEGEVTP